MHGLWSSNIPSRFLDELPEAHVEIGESKGGFSGYGNAGASRFDEMTHFSSGYTTPGWQRAQRKADRGTGFDEGGAAFFGESAPNGAQKRARAASGKRHLPRTIEGELVAKSTGTVSDYVVGDRVFHQKFGNGNVTAVDGNKLTIMFDQAGEKRVVDNFVQRA
jgi:DNA helicase-2/ATP-dependent DNA helicase PcrA